MAPPGSWCWTCASAWNGRLATSRARSTSRCTTWPGQLDEVPPGTVWVHCRTGYRATVAASLLAACGRDVISVDDAIGNAVTAGLPVVPSQATVS